MFPHWGEANAPREIMHDIFSKGTGMIEMCGLLHVALVQQRWFTERQLNQAIANYPWPEDVRIPMITTKEIKATAVGQPIVRPALSPYHCHCHLYPRLVIYLHLHAPQGKYPRPDNKLDMTAYTFMVFAVHSTSLLGDLVPAEKKDASHWQSWLLHHQIICMVLAAEFTLEEV